MSRDERAVSDPVRQTRLADETLRGSQFYPFPDRVVAPDRREIAILIDRRTGSVIVKRQGQPDLLLSACEAFDRTWADASRPALRAGPQGTYDGAMRRGDGKWFVDTAEASDAEVRIVRLRLKGFGAIVSADTLSLGGAWGSCSCVSWWSWTSTAGGAGSSTRASRNMWTSTGREKSARRAPRSTTCPEGFSPDQGSAMDPSAWAVSTLDVLLQIAHLSSEDEAMTALRGFVRDPATEGAFREFSRLTYESPPTVRSPCPDYELTGSTAELVRAMARASERRCAHRG